MNSTRALCLLTTWAVVVLVCKGALLLLTLAGSVPPTSTSSPAWDRVLALRVPNDAPPASSLIPEVVMLAMHPRAPLASDAVERLSALRLAKDRGATFVTVRASGAPVRRVVEPRVVFEDDPRAPLSRTRINKWLAIHPNLELLEASRDEELRALGPAFAVFSGIYGAAVKARALRWLAEMTTHEHVWVLEPDVVYTGESWKDFFRRYDDAFPGHDLVAANSTASTGGASWPHASSCTLCAEGDGRWQTAFLPVFRISRRLARAVVEGLARNATGHHEAFIPTMCSRTPGCRWAEIHAGKTYRYRPFVKLSEARNESERGELYHPVKSADVFRELIA